LCSYFYKVLRAVTQANQGYDVPSSDSESSRTKLLKHFYPEANDYARDMRTLWENAGDTIMSHL